MHILAPGVHLVAHAEYTYGEKPFTHSYLTMMHGFPRTFAAYQPIMRISPGIISLGSLLRNSLGFHITS